MNGLEGRCTGTIGRDHMAPTEVYVTDKKTGEERLFRKFSIFVDNKYQQGNRQVLKVIIPNNNYGEKMFKALAPGRRVEVEGVIYHKPRAVEKDGELKAYENAEMQMSMLHFMDTPLRGQRDWVLNTLLENGAIDKEMYEDYHEVITQRIELGKNLDQNDPFSSK